MKKVYETPEVEKIAFQYRDQVVVASGCHEKYSNVDTDGNKICDTGDPVFEGYTK